MMSDQSETDHESDSENRPMLVPSLRRFALLLIVLAGVLALAYPVFAWIGYRRTGLAGVTAAAAAGGICFASAGLALLLAALVREPQQAVSALLGGMILRTGIPLVFGIVMKERGGTLADGEILAMVLPYYLLTLLTETLLSLKLVPAGGKQPLKA